MKLQSLVLLISLSILSACTNQRLSATKISRESGSSTSTPPPSDTLKISSVSITTTGSAASSVQATKIFFDTSQSTAPVSNYCTSTGASLSTDSAKPCLCQFTWQEVNTVGASAVSIPRLVHTPVSAVQPNQVTCNAPEVYATEIPDGALIKISVIPAPANTESFSLSAFNFTKSKNADTGSFKDSQGRSFMNVLRYSCYDQRARGMTIQSKLATENNPNQSGDYHKLPVGNRFCVQKANSNGVQPEGCENLPPPDYSAQTYYYNLYVRESEVGDINPGNGRYVCPTVKESLVGGGGGIGDQGKYWPLDTSFALSLAKTADFTVGVVANSKASNLNDPTASHTSCDASSSGGASGSSAGLTASCLGFAAKPNSDGTCPYFRDASGSIRFTYRLRRFIALYPPIFDTSGLPLQEPQPTDTIYVVDRPVAAAINPDPLKPFTMQGPKPCPFAYFDHKGVLEQDPLNTIYSRSYAGTNDPRWIGTNVDGIELPRFDGPNSCSATVPLVNSDRTMLSLGTVHASNPTSTLKRVFIRPIRAWAPHYIEDLDFQACAPLSDPFRDPPLHFARNGSEFAWCAEAYPTQNDNVAKLDTQFKAMVSTRKGLGNGLVSDLTVGPLPQEETITATMQGSGNFDVRGTLSGPIGTVAPGVLFQSGRINFRISNGATPFAVGDQISFLITAALTPNSYYVSSPAASNNGTGAIVGNGTVVEIAPGSGPFQQTITARCSTPSPCTTFAVSGSVSGGLGNATAGNAFTSAAINFQINAGSTPFSQNDQFVFSVIQGTNNAYSGLVRPFTSHVVKNTTTAACTVPMGAGKPRNLHLPENPSNPNFYPATGKAYHLGTDFIDTNAAAVQIFANQTCDRTVVNPLDGTSWPRFPLLAPPGDVERALEKDSSYSCAITYDNGGSRSAAKQSPRGGCCGGGVLTSDKAHLEPNPDLTQPYCQAPQY